MACLLVLSASAQLLLKTAQNKKEAAGGSGKLTLQFESIIGDTKIAGQGLQNIGLFLTREICNTFEINNGSYAFLINSNECPIQQKLANLLQ